MLGNPRVLRLGAAATTVGIVVTGGSALMWASMTPPDPPALVDAPLLRSTEAPALVSAASTSCLVPESRTVVRVETNPEFGW